MHSALASTEAIAKGNVIALQMGSCPADIDARNHGALCNLSVVFIRTSRIFFAAGATI